MALLSSSSLQKFAPWQSVLKLHKKIASFFRPKLQDNTQRSVHHLLSAFVTYVTLNQSSTVKAASSLQNLPVELLQEILGHKILSADDLANLSQVLISDGAVRDIASREILDCYRVPDSAEGTKGMHLSIDCNVKTLRNLAVAFRPSDSFPSINSIDIHFSADSLENNRRCLYALKRVIECSPHIPSVALHFPPGETFRALCHFVDPYHRKTQLPLVVFSGTSVKCFPPLPSNTGKGWRRQFAGLGTILKMAGHVVMEQPTPAVDLKGPSARLRFETVPDVGTLVFYDRSRASLSISDKRRLSPSQWHSVLPFINPEGLMSLSVSVDLNLDVLSTFLKRSEKAWLMTLDMSKSHVDDSRSSCSAFDAKMPKLMHLTTSAGLAAHILKKPDHFPSLRAIRLSERDDSADLHSDYQEAYTAITRLHAVEEISQEWSPHYCPWKRVEASETGTRAERYLRIEKLDIRKWNPAGNEWQEFTCWLALFPTSLRTVEVQVPADVPAKALILCRDEAAKNAKEFCPHIELSVVVSEY